VNILIVGPQHSTTRYLVCLMKQHKDVASVAHCSVPSANKYTNFDIGFDSIDKFIILSRDMASINASNFESSKGKIKIEENISKTAGNFILVTIKKIKNKENYIDSIIHFFSYESLLLYREEYFKYFLKAMNLSTDCEINFNNNNTVQNTWFSINLKLDDCNKKYNKYYSDVSKDADKN
jgi:hypothetical protein